VKASVTWFMVTRAIELSLISLYDTSPPVLVSRIGEKQPLPETLKGRLIYALDQLVATTGTSFVPGKYWEYAPTRVANYRSPFSSKRSFIIFNIRRAVLYYLLLDIGDTLVKRYLTFDLSSPTPILDLPFRTQCLTGFQTAMYIFSCLSFYHAILAIALVGSGFSTDLDNWPPLFGRPFLSPSISYFWSQGWHVLFRRTFERFSVPMVALFGLKSLDNSRTLSKPGKPVTTSYLFVSVIIAFVTSGILHSFIIQRIYDIYDDPIDRSTWTVFQQHPEFFFFAIQPLGIAVDRSFAQLGDSSRIRIIRWFWAWGFLLWTSRWVSDAFAKSHVWHGKDIILPISPVRGVLFGDWTGDDSIRIAFERLEIASIQTGSRS